MPFVLSEGTVLAERYQILRHLRSGSMGAVYEVFDLRTCARRALKMMLPGTTDATLRARFEREARIAGQLGGDHVVHVSDVGVDDATGLPYLVMELLDGEDLGTMIRTRGPLSPSVVMTYIAQIGSALERLHAAGVVHRDLKPDNLFLTTRDDGSPSIKLLDFGVAKLYTLNSAKGTCVLGTPLYMAPEQITGDGQVTPAADIHALGHVAYTLLVGRAYWDDGESNSIYRVFSRVTSESPEPPSTRAMRMANVVLPGEFDRWFMVATAKNPSSRFPRARLAAHALELALGESDHPSMHGSHLAQPSSAKTNGSPELPAASTYTSAERSVVTTIPGLRKAKPLWILIASCGILLCSIGVTSWSIRGLRGGAAAGLREPVTTNVTSTFIPMPSPTPPPPGTEEPVASGEVLQEKPDAGPAKSPMQFERPKSSWARGVATGVRHDAPAVGSISVNPPAPRYEPMD